MNGIKPRLISPPISNAVFHRRSGDLSFLVLVILEFLGILVEPRTWTGRRNRRCSLTFYRGVGVGAQIVVGAGAAGRVTGP